MAATWHFCDGLSSENVFQTVLVYQVSCFYEKLNDFFKSSFGLYHMVLPKKCSFSDLVITLINTYSGLDNIFFWVNLLTTCFCFFECVTSDFVVVISHFFLAFII